LKSTDVARSRQKMQTFFLCLFQPSSPPRRSLRRSRRSRCCFLCLRASYDPSLLSCGVSSDGPPAPTLTFSLQTPPPDDFRLFAT
jgi:hypothetical protein